MFSFFFFNTLVNSLRLPELLGDFLFEIANLSKYIFEQSKNNQNILKDLYIFIAFLLC